MSIIVFFLGLIIFSIIGGPIGAIVWIILFFFAAYAAWAG